MKVIAFHFFRGPENAVCGPVTVGWSDGQIAVTDESPIRADDRLRI